MRKTEYRSKPRWRLWLLILAGLLVLACDVSDCWRTGGNGDSTQPAKPACSLAEHFDYPVGSLPPGWQLFNTPEVQVAVREYEGNKWLGFSLVEGKGYERFAIHGTLVCQCRQFTVKMKFLTNHDFGGGLIGYEGEGDHIRIVLNPFHNKLLIEEHRGNSIPVKVEKTVTIDSGITYWLRIIPNYQAKSLEVQLSTDGSSFSQIAVASGFTKMEGKYGLTTFGPNKPETLFDDFIVEGESSAPVVVPPSPTPKKILTNELVISDGILFSEDQVWPREEIWADFTLKNKADFAVTLDSLLLAVRGLDEDKGYRQDFTAVSNITIGPNETYSYHQTQKYGYDQLGRYRAFVMALVNIRHVPEGKDQWYRLNPDPQASGLIGEVTFTVREMTDTEKVGTAMLQGPYGVVIKNGDVEWTMDLVRCLRDLHLELRPCFYNLPSLAKFKSARAIPKAVAQYQSFGKLILISGDALTGPTVWERLCLGEDGGLVSPKRWFEGWVVHEMTHARQCSDAEKKAFVHPCRNQLVLDYASLVRWKLRDKAPCSQEEDYYGQPRPPLLCARGSEESVLEDMSETARFFYLFPKMLQGRSPQRYQFAKERLFEGAEY